MCDVTQKADPPPHMSHLVTICGPHPSHKLCDVLCERTPNSYFVQHIVAFSTFISWIERFRNFSCIFVQKLLYQFARLPAVKLDMDLVHFHYLRAQ